MGLPRWHSVRLLVEAKERQAGPRGNNLSCIWVEGNDGAPILILMSALFPPSSPASSLSGCTSTSRSQPSSDGTCGPRARAHAFHTECLVVSARNCAPGVWDREERWAAQGRSLLACDAGDVEVEISCPQCGVRGVLTPAEWRDRRWAPTKEGSRRTFSEEPAWSEDATLGIPKAPHSHENRASRGLANPLRLANAVSRRLA